MKWSYLATAKTLSPLVTRVASVVVILTTSPTGLLAFENNQTHRSLALGASPAQSLNPKLAVFGFPPTSDFPSLGGARRKPFEILAAAAVLEDVPVCRVMNHFHRVDKSATATDSGLTDLKVGARIVCAAIDPANDDRYGVGCAEAREAIVLRAASDALPSSAPKTPRAATFVAARGFHVRFVAL